MRYENKFRKETRLSTWCTVEYYPYKRSLNDQKLPSSSVAALLSR